MFSLLVVAGLLFAKSTNARAEQPTAFQSSSTKAPPWVFAEIEIVDVDDFLLSLLYHDTGEAAEFLWKNFSVELQRTIASHYKTNQTVGNNFPLRRDILEELDAIVRGPSMYNRDKPFKNVKLSLDTEHEIAMHPTGSVDLNRFLLLDAYPNRLRRAGSPVNPVELPTNDSGTTLPPIPLQEPLPPIPPPGNSDSRGLDIHLISTIASNLFLLQEIAVSNRFAKQEAAFANRFEFLVESLKNKEAEIAILRSNQVTFLSTSNQLRHFADELSSLRSAFSKARVPQLNTDLILANSNALQALALFQAVQRQQIATAKKVKSLGLLSAVCLPIALLGAVLLPVLSRRHSTRPSIPTMSETADHRLEEVHKDFPKESIEVARSSPKASDSSSGLPEVSLATGLLEEVIAYLEQRWTQINPDHEEGGVLVGWRSDNGNVRGYHVVGFIDSGPNASTSAGHLDVDNEYITKQLALWSYIFPQLEILGFIHRHPGQLDKCSSGDIAGDVPVVKAASRKEMVFGIITINHPNKADLLAHYKEGSLTGTDRPKRYKINFFYLGHSSNYKYQAFLPDLARLQVLNSEPRIRLLKRFGLGAMQYFEQVLIRDFPDGKLTIQRHGVPHAALDLLKITMISADKIDRIYIIEEAVGQFRTVVQHNGNLYAPSRRKLRDPNHALNACLDVLEQVRES